MSNPTGDAINAFFGVAPGAAQSQAAPLGDEIAAVKLDFANRSSLYVPFNVGELEKAGLTSAYAVDTIGADARISATASRGAVLYTGASFVPLMQTALLDTDKCFEFGPRGFTWEGYPLSEQATQEADEPFTTDVVNGDLDDAEDAFNS